MFFICNNYFSEKLSKAITIFQEERRSLSTKTLAWGYQMTKGVQQIFGDKFQPLAALSPLWMKLEKDADELSNTVVCAPADGRRYSMCSSLSPDELPQRQFSFRYSSLICIRHNTKLIGWNPRIRNWISESGANKLEIHIFTMHTSSIFIYIHISR